MINLYGWHQLLILQINKSIVLDRSEQNIYFSYQTTFTIPSLSHFINVVKLNSTTGEIMSTQSLYYIIYIENEFE